MQGSTRPGAYARTTWWARRAAAAHMLATLQNFDATAPSQATTAADGVDAKLEPRALVALTVQV